MRGAINSERHRDQIAQQIDRTRNDMLFAIKKSAHPVDIVLRTPEVVDWRDDPSGQCLILPASFVIAQTTDGPKQQRRRHHMEQAQQPDEQRHGWIKHEFRAADEVLSEQERRQEIKREQGLKEQQSSCLPGEEERALRPQRDCDEEISQVAEVKEVLRAILFPVKRCPGHHPEGPTQLEPKRQAHGRNSTRGQGSFRARLGFGNRLSTYQGNLLLITLLS